MHLCVYLFILTDTYLYYFHYMYYWYSLHVFVDAKKQVKEQAGALRREKEHKLMVESALEKLRLERESRTRQRWDQYV